VGGRYVGFYADGVEGAVYVRAQVRKSSPGTDVLPGEFFLFVASSNPDTAKPPAR